ncbi:hypothetical protein HPC38_06880 [Pasteurellaceae bacterium HPA106]|uniref:hypothetical protein n=1 Tax=Spirabiliibacterium pneumoniae TaxID=221400 RepID=UPI001AAD9919|nr:hypothetical protein [Spirabiliibacterium pneumoniae]MBE2896596.1 hypothetical protein [Spirabiliibacterium pneumoniae]
MYRFILISASALLSACTQTPISGDSALPSYQAEHQTPAPNAKQKTSQNQTQSVLNASDYAQPVRTQPVRIAPRVGFGYALGDFYGPSIGANFYPWWW